MESQSFDKTDRWLESEAPNGNVAVSTRARFARNLVGFPFAPHANQELLSRVETYVAEAFGRSEFLRTFDHIDLTGLNATDRSFLRENRIISKEMERGGKHLCVYLSPEARASILINEEDHLRTQVIAPGCQIKEAVSKLQEIDKQLSAVLGFAWNEKYGYLTACPTNVGTGFRASVMVHLPALSMLQEVDSSLQGITHYGLTVRGFEGENSECTGDFYQISNEVTLGRTVEQIVDVLSGVIQRIIDRESEARINLFKYHASTTEDSIWRSYGLLAHSHRMDSTEAMKLLSRLRLGIDKGYFPELTHHELTRQVMEIQPAHLERRRVKSNGTPSRDEIRAELLREWVRRVASRN